MAIEGFTGVTVIDCSAGGDTVTVIFVAPLTEETVARIDVVPLVEPKASPSEIVATLVLDEFQLAVLVRSWVLLSL